jgi:hypothetical protein
MFRPSPVLRLRLAPGLDNMDPLSALIRTCITAVGFDVLDALRLAQSSAVVGFCLQFDRQLLLCVGRSPGRRQTVHWRIHRSVWHVPATSPPSDNPTSCLFGSPRQAHCIWHRLVSPAIPNSANVVHWQGWLGMADRARNGRFFPKGYAVRLHISLSTTVIPSLTFWYAPQGLHVRMASGEVRGQ